VFRVETRGRVLGEDLRHVGGIGTLAARQAVAVPGDVEDAHGARLVRLDGAHVGDGRHGAAQGVRGDPRVGVEVAGLGFAGVGVA